MHALLTFVATLVCANAQSDIRGEKVPVKIEVAPDMLEKLTPEAREMVESVKRLAENHLWTWETLEADLPESAFKDNKAIITRTDLFRTSENSETRELMLTETGERRRFGPEHLEDFRNEAKIVVPSQRYPGRNHVWRVKRVWMKGLKGVQITFDKSKSEAYDQIVIQTADRWTSGKGLNVPDGTRRFIKGWRELLGAMVGALEMEPKYDAQGVIRELRAEAERDLRANGAEIDLRLYDAKTRDRANQIFADFTSDFERHWRVSQSELIALKIAEGRGKDLKDEALSEYVREQLFELRSAEFFERLRGDKALEKLSPGLAELLEQRARAAVIAQDELAKAKAATDAEATRLTEEYEGSHRVLKWIPQRTAKKLAPAIEAADHAHREIALRATIQRLKDEGIENEAKILEANAAYYAGPALAKRAELEAELSPKRVLNLTRSIWRSKDWTPNPDHSGEELRFWPTTTKTTTVDSDAWGWRAELALARAHWAISELNRTLWFDLFANGLFGYRAVFGKDKFFARDRMNPKTGEIEPDPSSLTGTWRTVRKDIGDLRLADEARFEAKPDGDIMAKSVTRPIVYGWYGAKNRLLCDLWDSCNLLGFLGTTSLTVVGSGLSPLLAPAYAVGAWLSDFVIVDSTSNRPWRTGFSPLLVNFGGRVGGGALEVLGAVAASAVVHPVAGVGIFLGGATYATVRNAWDEAWYQVFRRLYLPVNDTGYITDRVSGPGLEQNFEFKISPKLTLVALRAALEAEELKILETRIEERAKEPVAEARRHLAEPLSVLSMQTPQADWYTSIGRSADRAYQNAVKPVHEQRSNLPRVRENRVRLRIARADIPETIAGAERMVDDFWKGRENQVDWNARALKKGDARGLAERMLQEIFGAQFLEPVDPADDTVIFEEKTPNFGAAFDKMLAGLDIHPSDVSSDIERELPPKQVQVLDPRGDARDIVAVSLTPCEKLFFPN